MDNRIIFLDIDGVLNCEKSKSKCPSTGDPVGIDTDKIRRLKRIVDETGAEVVLISSWKDFYEVGAYKQEHRIGKYMNNKFRKFGIKIKDKTFGRGYVFRSKGILDWLKTHPEVTNFVILDDEEFFGYDQPPLKDYVIHTFWKGNGLTEASANMAIKMLKDEAAGAYSDTEDFAKAISWSPHEHYFGFLNKVR